MLINKTLIIEKLFLTLRELRKPKSVEVLQCLVESDKALCVKDMMAITGMPSNIIAQYLKANLKCGAIELVTDITLDKRFRYYQATRLLLEVINLIEGFDQDLITQQNS